MALSSATSSAWRGWLAREMSKSAEWTMSKSLASSAPSAVPAWATSARTSLSGKSSGAPGIREAIRLRRWVAKSSARRLRSWPPL